MSKNAKEVLGVIGWIIAIIGMYRREESLASKALIQTVLTCSRDPRIA